MASAANRSFKRIVRIGRRIGSSTWRSAKRRRITFSRPRRLHWSGWRTWRASNCTRCIRASRISTNPITSRTISIRRKVSGLRVSELALEFKEHLEQFGYHAFVKTTGRKGLHVLTPIEPKWSFHEVFDVAKSVAQPFVESHGSVLTLQIKKDYRAGKVLLDIYR